jgi:hypothetical protein
MQGKWINADRNGVLRSVELAFPCCDQVFNGVLHCDPPQASVHAHGPCATGTCDWGTVVPDYVFQDEVGDHQVTRVDATFRAGAETRRLVILLFSSDSLLVHWSVDYPEGSGQKDFSLIEYFHRLQCITLPGGQTVCFDLARRVFDPADLLDRPVTERPVKR